MWSHGRNQKRNENKKYSLKKNENEKTTYQNQATEKAVLRKVDVVPGIHKL